MHSAINVFIPHLAVICPISGDFQSIDMAPNHEDTGADMGADMDYVGCHNNRTYKRHVLRYVVR